MNMCPTRTSIYLVGSFQICSYDFTMKNFHFLRTCPIATHGKGSSRRTRCLNFLHGETPNIGGESN